MPLLRDVNHIHTATSRHFTNPAGQSRLEQRFGSQSGRYGWQSVNSFGSRLLVAPSGTVPGVSRSNWIASSPGETRYRRNCSCYNNGVHRGSMALIVFLRGINVGGHRTFRPSMLARDLAAYDVVNVGAAGTLVVRKPVSRTKFLAELRRKLPFEAAVSFCDARDLIRLETENPFGAEPFDQDVVRFVSILSKASRGKASLPIAFPPGEKWFVRIIGSRKRLVFGVYRRHMRTIGYLGEIDGFFGAPATTRSWSTMLSVLRILKDTLSKQTKGMMGGPSKKRSR